MRGAAPPDKGRFHLVERRQLGIPFPQDRTYDPHAFIEADANAEALAWANRPQEWPGGRLAVFGAEGSGKTHLLHRFAARHGAILLSAASLTETIREPPGCPLAIDDADAAPGQNALLHLLNTAAEAAYPVMLAARTAPSRWDYSLPDLVSRLRAITSVGLHDPDDALLRALLARLLADRQLVVPEPLQAFMLARLPRTGAALRDVAGRLDEASLASGGSISRPLVNSVLEAMR